MVEAAAVAFASGGLALLTYAALVEPRRVVRTFLRVVIPQLRADHRFLVLGDLHLRPRSRSSYRAIRSAAAWARSEGAQAALLIGDLVERDDEADIVAPMLMAALHPLETMYVSGNHELDRTERVHWPLKRNDARRIRSALEAHGAACADDRLVDLGDLLLFGMPWQGWRVGPTAETRSSLPRFDRPTVLLTHSPDHVIGMRGSGVTFAFCGHTHGGQVRLPLVGAPWSPTLRRVPRSSGLMVIDAIPTYVTRGLNATIPLRFGARPEVVLVGFAPVAGRPPAGVAVVEHVVT